MKKNFMPIVRTDISKIIDSHLNKREIVFLWGRNGVGKSYISEAVAHNNSKKKNIDYYFIECVKPKNENNDCQIYDYQIYDYNSFLSYILINTFDIQFSPSSNQKKKDTRVRSLLTNNEHHFIFVFDDFDNINGTERDSIFACINQREILENHYFIFTSASRPNLYKNNLEICFGREIEEIKKKDFYDICEKHINSIKNPNLKEKIFAIKNSVGKTEYYDFIFRESRRDLCLMHDIHLDLVIKIFSESEKISTAEIKEKFNSIKYNYRIGRGDIINVILDNLDTWALKFLYAVSLFTGPVSRNTLIKITNCVENEIENFDHEFEKLYFFDDYLKKNEVVENGEKIITYYISSKEMEYTLKSRINGYKSLINNWINYYKEFTNNEAKKLDYDLLILSKIKKEFNTISNVLNYCSSHKKFEDYYDISNNIWYFCELTNKNLDDYHYKRFEIALEIGDKKKIFESALHYCNNAYKLINKKWKKENFVNCLKEIESKKEHIKTVSYRLYLKYLYTKALGLYRSETNYEEAEKLFKRCEAELPTLIKREENNEEKILLVKDYISVVKWHSMCFLDNFEKNNEKKFLELNNEIERSLAYEMNYGIDYSRVISSILISRIKLLLKYTDSIPNFRNRIINDYSILKYFEKFIEKDSDMPDEYNSLLNESKRFIEKSYLNESENIINKTLNDSSQKKIIPILQETKKLLLLAIKKESNQKGKVSITAMPDLGLANNIIRMSGGFFTGMFLEWESKVPIVPIDTTINSCGVAIYQLKKEISIQDFINSFENVDTKIKNELGYNWNFERGNHFITLGKLDNGNYCIVMHASADEYKNDMGKRSLYPPAIKNEKKSVIWYAHDIKTIFSAKNKNRYLRYLTGDTANKFISIAIRLETVNHIRMQEISTCLFKKYIDKELLFVPHYGMPSYKSIAIGCSWKKELSVLLTAPEKDIYIIGHKDRETKTNDNKWLTPHGLGVSASIENIKYKKGLTINNKQIKDLNDIKKIEGRSIRCRNDNEDDFNKHIDSTLSICQAERKTVIHPLVTYSAEGIKIIGEKNECHQK